MRAPKNFSMDYLWVDTRTQYALLKNSMIWVISNPIVQIISIGTQPNHERYATFKNNNKT